jgi:hypothetical protein
MRTRRVLAFLAVSAFSWVCVAQGQDSQSLGDVARQSRQQKQQKDAQAKDSPAQNQNKDPQSKDPQSTTKDAPSPKAPHVITNDEIPEHVGPTGTARGPQTYSTPDAAANSGNHDARAEQWKSQIQNQKSAIASLQREIASLNESVHYAGGNCVANCVQWNERQKEKQDRVAVMQQQLEEQQKRLEDMQESARKQGFGSSVYDP